MQVHKYASVQVCKCTSVQVCKYTNMQVYKYVFWSAILNHMQKAGDGVFFNCQNLDIWVFDIRPVCKKASMQVHWYTSILVYKNTRMYMRHFVHRITANSSILFDFVIDNQLEILAC